MKQENYKLTKIELTQNDRKSVKSCSTAIENEFNSPFPLHFSPLVSQKFRLQLFEGSEQGIQISQKINQRAVSWLITFCWTKNLSQQCLWLSILLFYSCKVKRRIKKDDLQLTLLTCLSLSLKMLENQYYSPKKLTGFCCKPFAAADIIEMEARILEIVDFNLVIPHQLSELLLVTTFYQEKLQQIMMICELMMMKDYDIFMNHTKLQLIIKRLEGQGIQDLNVKNMVLEVRDLLQLKQAKIILHKYSSKIDIQLLNSTFF